MLLMTKRLMNKIIWTLIDASKSCCFMLFIVHFVPGFHLFCSFCHIFCLSMICILFNIILHLYCLFDATHFCSKKVFYANKIFHICLLHIIWFLIKIKVGVSFSILFFILYFKLRSAVCRENVVCFFPGLWGSPLQGGKESLLFFPSL